MKTRIKVIEKNDGSKKYVCQRFGQNSYLFWLTILFPIIGWVYIYKNFIWNDLDDNSIYNSLEQAEIRINFEIKKLKANKTKSITYIKYP